MLDSSSGGTRLGQVAYPTCWAEESGRSRRRPRSIVAVATIAFKEMASLDSFIGGVHCYWRGEDAVEEEAFDDRMGSWMDA